MPSIFLINVAKSYYGLNINQKPTILSFKKEEHVKECVNFLATFKQQYGRWPPMENSGLVEDIGDEYIKKSSLDDIIKIYIDVETQDEKNFADYCTSNSIALMCVNEYSCQIQNKHMSISFDAEYMNDLYLN